MADNFPTDAGSGGLTFASDDIGGVHYPLTKLTFGALDSQTIASSGTGTDDAGTQRVTLATDIDLPTGPVTNAGTFAVQSTLQAGTAAFGKLSANSGVDIGDVDVTSVIPSTGATNLGKAIDAVVGSADVGVALLAKHQGNSNHVSVDDGDYDILRTSEFGALHTEPEQHIVIDDMDALLGNGGTWAAIDSDTTGVASSTKHVLGSASVEFDKVDGAANSGIGGVTKALTSIDLGGLSPHDIFQCVVQVGATTELDGGSAFFFLRLGTDSTDYNEWRIDGIEFTAGIWETVALEVGDASFAGQGGAGADFSAITYIAVGFSFDAVGDALANIYVDEISFHTNQHVNAAINAEISSSVTSANINLQKVAGSPATKSSGNVGAGTQRVTLADDDTNASAIKTAVEIIDNAVHVDDAGFTLGTDSGVMMMGFAGTQSVDANDAGAIAIEADGSIHCALDTETTKVIGSVIPAAAATGGMSFDMLALAAEDNDKVIKASAGTLYYISVQSIDATPVYLKLFDATSITPGTTSADLQFMCPANTTAANGAGIVLDFSRGIEFATGIVALIATGIALDDNTAVSANEVVVTLGFE